MIAGLLLAASTALAAPSCGDLSSPGRGSTSVAWVAPASQRVLGTGWLTVVPTRALRAWIEAEQADAARLLQRLGRRRSSRDPVRTWVVTVFEVDAGRLCRPIDEDAAGGAARVGDAAVCPHFDKKVQGTCDGCGRTIDRALNRPALEVFAIQWRDAAARGFCVLPIDRFLQGT
ncbi:MAG: hypothetical protein H6733_13515 [Alphaproteobacteria bacterium]|nr:hypothetical protein [Alphaproteobacteria bacterium]